MNNKANMITGNVKTILINKTIPMIFGVLGLIIFNIVDTYFVSCLGTEQLAALSFTFPVVLVLNSVALGIGTGTVSALSREIGKGNQRKVIRIATDSLTLGLAVVLIFVVVGLTTINPLFRMLGAGDGVMTYINTYMRIWYMGVLFVVIPMVGNNSIRAMGDTKTPGIVMLIAAVVNTILDPLLIFGIGPFPELGVAGAAIATVISRMVTFSVALYVLVFREKVISFRKILLNEVLDSWKLILFIGLPNTLSKIILPIGMGIITSFLASNGVAAVAGFGVSTKIERFATILVAALAVVVIPFIGQNFGAKKFERIRASMKLSYRFSLISCGLIYLFLIIIAKPISGIFSDDIEVIKVIVRYLYIVPISYGYFGIQQISISVLNAFHKPVYGVFVSLIQMVLFMPLGFVGSKYFGLNGIFGAIGVSYIIAGSLGQMISYRILNVLEIEQKK